MTNAKIASQLDTVADLLEFDGANAFRVRAYRKAARIIADHAESIAAIYEDPDRELTDVEGIGKDLAQKIGELVDTGELAMLAELLDRIPASVLDLMRVPGMGPKKAAVLHAELGIADLDALRAACEAGQVRDLKGFGKKTEQSILAGLEIAAAANQRRYWAEAERLVTPLVEDLRKLKSVAQLEVAGSFRRGRDTIGDIDLLVDAERHDEVMDRLANHPEVADVIGRGETKCSVRFDSGLQVDLRVVPAESFGAALQYFTGSKDHNVVLRGRAKSAGLKINEYGVFRGDEMIAGRTEADVYAVLGLPLIPPELREARREFDWADANELPELVTVDDIRGDLHMHTTATDGRATLEEMVAAAKQRKLKYIAITDHSKRVSMAGGLDADRLRRQWEDVDRVNDETSGITVLKGIECDILEPGGLDLDDDVLADADWVVASVHYGQNQPREQITRRIVDALANPNVSAIAHPTGRILNRREPYEVDLDAVFAAAAEHGKFLELNANPARLDLNDVHCAAAKSHGIPIVISTDAHRVDGLDCLRYGVLQARRAGLTKQDVANTRTWPQLRKLLGNKA